MVVSIELYTVLDSTMLGFLQGDAAVGRYTAAVKVNKITISLITSAGAVLIPRFSYYIRQEAWDKIEKLVSTAYNFIFMFSIPGAIGLFMISDEIILLFGGQGFTEASFTMQLLTPITVVISFSSIVNSQTFVPMGKEVLSLQSTIVGAVTNFSLNLLLIPVYAENGAAVATVVAEVAVAAVCFKNIGKYYNRKNIFSKVYQYVIASIPILLITRLMHYLQWNYVLYLCATMLLSMLTYFSLLFLFKNPYLLEMIHIAKRKKDTGREHRS